MSVQVVVPWRVECDYRLAAWTWVQSRYRHPVAPVGVLSPYWVKAEAVMFGVRRSDADIVVMADADVWTDGLDQAIEAVESGAPWAVPHWLVHRLSKEGTAAVLGGAQWRSQPLDRDPYQGVVGGGYVVARRDVFLEAPLDPRFVGWGNEDESWGLALTTLFGQPWRGDADLVHLWHPPQERLSPTRGSRESWDLRRRYIDAFRHHQATGSTNQMRHLCLEANDALNADQPAVHDRETEPVGQH